MPDSSQASSMPAGSGKNERTSTGLTRRFVDVLAWIITIAWAISFIIDALVKQYEPPITIHVLMTTVAGAAFGSALIKRNGNGSIQEESR